MVVPAMNEIEAQGGLVFACTYVPSTDNPFTIFFKWGIEATAEKISKALTQKGFAPWKP